MMMSRYKLGDKVMLNGELGEVRDIRTGRVGTVVDLRFSIVTADCTGVTGHTVSGVPEEWVEPVSPKPFTLRTVNSHTISLGFDGGWPGVAPTISITVSDDDRNSVRIVSALITMDQTIELIRALQDRIEFLSPNLNLTIPS